ncbi:HNH endonuclease [Nocardia transvalensis]|uniref:HNH endonuclease n=1 Tax=Nocardia transvalensis TaxID=37333 RepID=UPI003A5CD83C
MVCIGKPSRLRLSIESGDRVGIIHSARALTIKDDNGCHIWSRELRKGYPVYRYRSQGRSVSVSVHRIVLEARLGYELDSNACHHRCGKSACINPDHLQLVTNADNNAEMLARKYYVSRIRELEHALSVVSPEHCLLRAA